RRAQGVLAFAGGRRYQRPYLLGDVACAEDESRLRAGENRLEQLQLLQARELRALGEQLGRVGLAARCGGLFATTNEVGLGFLRRGDDAVEQQLHVARQDDVAQADA